MNNPAHNANRNLFKLAETFLQKLNPGPIAVAVSGGCDSIATLDLISKANTLKRDIYCFTVDHQLRDEAKLEAQFVADFCAYKHIKHQTLTWEEEKPSTGLQSAARWARYKLLCDACENVGVVGLVTGHNLDDQIETVQMRKLRDKTGDGVGLSGMAPAALFFNSMWVLRPFLSVRKQQLKDHLLQASIDWVEDPSNHSEKFERVRIRNQSDQTINADDINGHARSRRTLSELAANYIRQYCRTKDSLVFEVTVADAEKQTLEKVLEVLVHIVGGRDRSLGRKDIETLYDFATSSDGKRTTMGRVVLDKKANEIRLCRENRGFSECVINPKEEICWDGRFLIANVSSGTEIIVQQDNDQIGCPPVMKKPYDEEWLPVRECDLLTVKPVINKYDLVLSEFDLELANSIAALLARSAYLLPFGDAKMQNQQD